MSKYVFLLRHIASKNKIPIPLFHLKKATDPIFEIFWPEMFKTIERVQSFLQAHYSIPTNGSFRSELCIIFYM